MKKFACTIALSAALAFSLRADPQSALADATQPMDEGVPEVAVARLQNLLPKLSGADVLVAKEKLAEALLESHRAADALRVVDDTRLPDSAKFVRARVLAELSRYEEALPLFESIANDAAGPRRAEAAFGAAEMFRALGRYGEAIRRYAILENDSRFGVTARLREAELFIGKRDTASARRILDATQPKATVDKRQKRLLRGRVELLNGHADKAIGLLDPLAKRPEGASHETVVSALFAMADAHLDLNTPESGDDYLEEFIDGHPADAALASVFAKLDQLYRAERKPPRNELEKWARDAAQPRRGFARWYLAQNDWRAGRHEEALRHYQALMTMPGLSSALAPALLQYARIETGAARFAHALEILNAAQKTEPPSEVRAEIAFESGRALFGARKFGESATRFAQANAPRVRDAAGLNVALAWVEARDDAKLQAATRELHARNDAEAEADLALEQALTAAAGGEKKATASLQDFLRKWPAHARAAEAELALAELAFHSAPPRLDEAEKYLAATDDHKPPPPILERAAYLALWLAEARGAESDAVIARANEFLRDYPQSTFAPEVRMKLAETHFRRQDFASAQTQLETLARENPESPFTEKALFLAAQSAAAGMESHSLSRALELLTQVVKLNGELRWAARNEQAAIERRLGKPEDALVLYDEVLKGDAGAAERREALCGKADVSFEQAQADASGLDRAVALYDQLANDSANEPQWQNQALFKKGLCLEKKTDRAGALTTFYLVLEFRPGGEKPPEFFWYYKAGFNAARLLEEEQKWDSAAAIYDKLVAANGPRSEEAKVRLSQLRLEHFLWE